MPVKILVQRFENVLIVLTRKTKMSYNLMKIPYSAYHFRENPRPVGVENSVVPPRNC